TTQLLSATASVTQCTPTATTTTQLLSATAPVTGWTPTLTALASSAASTQLPWATAPVTRWTRTAATTIEFHSATAPGRHNSLSRYLGTKLVFSENPVSSLFKTEEFPLVWSARLS